MTTTMTSKITFACTITKTGNILTVLAPSGRDCKINLGLLDNAGLTSDEQSLVYGLEDEKTADLTAAEMRSLVSIREKINKLVNKAMPQQAAQHAAQGISNRTVGVGSIQAERNIDQMSRVFKTLKGDMWKLDYDIPTTSEVQNPSRLLWNFGFRSSESVWVLPDESKNHPTVQELFSYWRENGITFWTIRYHPDDMKVVKEQAHHRLCEEIRRQHKSLIECILAADTKLADDEKALDAQEQAATDKERKAIISKRNNAVRSRIKIAWQELREVVKSAEIFEETEAIADLVDGLKKAIRAQAAAFNATANEQGIKPAPTE